MNKKYMWGNAAPELIQDNAIREVRRREFSKIAKEHYKVLEGISTEEYKQLRDDFNSGIDNINELLEKSVSLIVSSVIDFYTRYEIEDLLPFEDGVSLALEFTLEDIQRFDHMPSSLSHYNRSIDYHVFGVLCRKYERALRHTSTHNIMPREDVEDIVDNQFYYEITNQNISREEVKNILAKLFNDLTASEAKFLIARYGLLNDKQLTFEEAGAKYGVTKQRAEDIVKRGLKRIRKHKLMNRLNEYVQDI